MGPHGTGGGLFFVIAVIIYFMLSLPNVSIAGMYHCNGSISAGGRGWEVTYERPIWIRCREIEGWCWKYI